MCEYERASKALKEVARREGVPLEEVLREVSLCIAEGMNRCREEKNVAALRQWDAIPKAGEIPTPVELVSYLSGQVCYRT